MKPQRPLFSLPHLTLSLVLICNYIAGSEALASDSLTLSNVCDIDECITEGEWELGVAVGAGVRLNPLADGDNIPLILLPDIAYYSEHIYFDNFELGTQFLPAQGHSIEWYVTPNAEAANFTFWQPENIFLPVFGQADNSLPDGEPLQDRFVSLDDIASRQWALDMGLRWQWTSNKFHWQISVSHDVSGRYSGQHAASALTYAWIKDDWQFATGLQLAWKSKALTDYYYGLDARDTADSQLWYQARGGIQSSIQFSASKRVSEDWTLLIRSRVTRLHSGMHESPLVDKTSTASLFVGFGYRF